MVFGVYVKTSEEVYEEHQVIGADERADRAGGAAAEGRAADDDRGEHLQKDRIAGERIAGALLRRNEDAGGAVASTGDGVDEELHEGDADTLGARCIHVAADRIDGAPQRRILQPEPEQDDDAEDHDRHRQEIGNGVADERARKVAGDHASRLVHDEQRQALDDEHRRQRDDDRLEADESDEEAVERPGEHADANAEQGPGDDARCGVLHIGGQNNVDEPDDGSGRQVESAGENDDGLADRGERERRAAARHEAHFEIAHRAGADGVVDDEQDDKDRYRDEQPAGAADAEAAEPRPRTRDSGVRHQATLRASGTPPSAAVTIASSDRWSRSISSTTCP